MKKKRELIGDSILLGVWIASGIARMLTPGDISKPAYFISWLAGVLVAVLLLLRRIC